MTTLARVPVPSGQALPVERQPDALPRIDPITRLPLLILSPHSRCNCRCLMCDIWRSDARDQLGADEIGRRLSEWRALGVERVLLSGGEPLMHPRLWDLCAHLRTAGIGITLLSTGLLLKRHASQLVQYCDDLVVSLDGPPQTHDAIRRVPRAFERLTQGLHAVAAAARASGATVRLSARCTVQRQNYRELRAIVRTAQALPLQHVSFLAADVSSSAFNRPVAQSIERGAAIDPGSGIALEADDLPALALELDLLEQEHAAAFRSGFIVESAARLRQRIYRYFAALLGLEQFPANRCNAPWVSTVIEADGTVKPCFFQPALGKLTAADSLLSILNSPEARRWRAGLQIDRDRICQRCVCTLALQTTK
ncbi:MAG TPA: radical SAM protein [Steroidobacteraceae bacterium]|nr:radical SAM protein [Steroidobacteraceae bacterium]